MSNQEKNKESVDYITEDRSRNKADKHATRFTVMLIPDSTDQTRSFDITFDTIARIAVSAAAVVIVVICLLISAAMKNYRLVHGDSGLNAQITELKEKNEELVQETSELQAQIESLSGVIETKQNEEKQAEESAQAEAMPTGLPLDGTAVLIQDPNAVEGETNENRVVFTAMAGTAVVSAGAGTVSTVTADPVYGNVVEIDHENGYVTIYRTTATIRVKAGDTVRKNDVIGMMSADDELLAYEIQKDGAPIAPLDIMEIAG